MVEERIELRPFMLLGATSIPSCEVTANNLSPFFKNFNKQHYPNKMVIVSATSFPHNSQVSSQSLHRSQQVPQKSNLTIIRHYPTNFKHLPYKLFHKIPPFKTCLQVALTDLKTALTTAPQSNASHKQATSKQSLNKYSRPKRKVTKNSKILMSSSKLTAL